MDKKKSKPARRTSDNKVSPKGRKAARKKKDGVPRRKVLFAPWRLEFILGPKDSGCFMCRAAKLPAGDERAWREMLLLDRNEHGLVIMNRYPYTGGHLLVAPLRHVADLEDLTEDEHAALWSLTRRAHKVVKDVMQPHGQNIGMNLGKAAGAGIEDHLHMHVMPRWVGDTNFLPAIGQTHTVPLALDEVWAQMRPHFSRKSIAKGKK